MNKPVEILAGDAMTVLKTLPENHVHCIVTSPPYWGLRDYGADGQLGLEKTPEEYIAKMVEVFREARRVLRTDGTLWLNMGDSYAGSWGNYHPTGKGGQREKQTERFDRRAYESTEFLPPTANCPGLKPKDLCMMPARLAIALQADGWWLRSEIVWSKPNPMPESVTDRPTKSHEMIYLLTKSARYFYDAEAVRENGTTTRPELLAFGDRPDLGGTGHNNDRRRSKMPDGWATHKGDHGSIHREGRENGQPSEIRYGRNCRSVWTIATAPYPEAHFATFPPKLAERCILAGTSERGCCPTCGKQWVRVVESTPEYAAIKAKRRNTEGYESRGLEAGRRFGSETPGLQKGTTTTGWKPSCSCGGAPVPCTVLDPFGGSGTTAEVAIRHGRRAILIELKPEYIELANRRIAPALELAKQEKINLFSP